MDVDPVVVVAVLHGIAEVVRAVTALVIALTKPARRKRK
jgi:hypothetical protein